MSLRCVVRFRTVANRVVSKNAVGYKVESPLRRHPYSSRRLTLPPPATLPFRMIHLRGSHESNSRVDSLCQRLSTRELLSWLPRRPQCGRLSHFQSFSTRSGPENDVQQTAAGNSTRHGKNTSNDRAIDTVSNWNIANALTVSRILASPLTAHFIIGGDHSLAMTTVAVAGVSDALDGWIARRYHLQTRLGSYLDPLADKVLVGCSFGALALCGELPIGLVGLVVGRDLALVAGTYVLRRRSSGLPLLGVFSRHSVLPPLAIQPTVLSKLNTGFQLCLVVVGIAHAGGSSFAPDLLFDSLCLATASTTIGSAVSYGHKFAKLWRSVKSM